MEPKYSVKIDQALIEEVFKSIFFTKELMKHLFDIKDAKERRIYRRNPLFSLIEKLPTVGALKKEFLNVLNKTSKLSSSERSALLSMMVPKILKEINNIKKSPENGQEENKNTVLE